MEYKTDYTLSTNIYDFDTVNKTITTESVTCLGAYGMTSSISDSDILVFGGTGSGVKYDTIQHFSVDDSFNLTSVTETKTCTKPATEMRSSFVNDAFYLFGGLGDSSYLDGYQKIKFGSSVTSVESGTSSYTPALGLSTVNIGDSIHILGGKTTASVYLVSIYEFNVLTASTNLLTTATLGEARYYSTCAVVGNYGYIIGGYNATTFSAKIDIFDSNTKSMVAVAG